MEIETEMMKTEIETMETEIETMETEVTSTEALNIAINESDTRSWKRNQVYIGDKSSNLNDTEASQNKRGIN